MADIAEKVGKYISGQVGTHPAYARQLLLAAYRAYGWKLRHMRNQHLSNAKNYLGTVSMDAMVRPLAHPDRQILTSIFTPCEVFHAMDLYPMCAEQFATYTNGAWSEHAFIEAAEQAGIAETFCSYHKAVIGAAVSGVLPKPLGIVNTSLACDANNLTFRKTAEMLDAPQFYIDIPYEAEEAAVDYVAEQLREMTVWLEDLAGKKLDPARLSECVGNSVKTISHLQRVLKLRKDRFVPAELTAELYEVLMVHNALGLPETLRYAALLHKEYLAAGIRPGRKILWLHSNPFYQGTVKQIFNYKEDPRIVLTEMCYDTLIGKPGEEDPGRRDPYRMMAERTVYNSFNGPVSRRAEKALEMAKTVEPDGVILFCHWGCKETCGGSTLIRDALEAAGYPVLVINGDGVDRRNSSDGQIGTRIEAFLEMLETS